MDIDRVLNKIKIKKINGIDVTNEYFEIFQFLFSKCNTEPDEYDTIVDELINGQLTLSDDVYVRCCQLFNLYLDTFNEFYKMFFLLKENENNDMWLKLIRTAYIFYAFNAKVFEILVEYGNWEPAEAIEEFENRLENKLVISLEVLESYIVYAYDVHLSIKDALLEKNKSKCMALAAYLFGVAYDIMTIIRLKQTEF